MYKPLFILVTLGAVVASRYAAVFPIAALVNAVRRARNSRIRRAPSGSNSGSGSGSGSSAGASAGAGMREELPREYQIMLFWAGLRGAVGFALSANIEGQNAVALQTTVLVTVVLTVIIFGGTTAHMLEVLGIRTGVADGADSSDDDNGGAEGDDDDDDGFRMGSGARGGRRRRAAHVGGGRRGGGGGGSSSSGISYNGSASAGSGKWAAERDRESMRPLRSSSRRQSSDDYSGYGYGYRASPTASTAQGKGKSAGPSPYSHHSNTSISRGAPARASGGAGGGEYYDEEGASRTSSSISSDHSGEVLPARSTHTATAAARKSTTSLLDTTPSRDSFSADPLDAVSRLGSGGAAAADDSAASASAADLLGSNVTSPGAAELGELDLEEARRGGSGSASARALLDRAGLIMRDGQWFQRIDERYLLPMFSNSVANRKAEERKKERMAAAAAAAAAQAREAEGADLGDAGTGGHTAAARLGDAPAREVIFGERDAEIVDDDDEEEEDSRTLIRPLGSAGSAAAGGSPFKGAFAP